MLSCTTPKSTSMRGAGEKKGKFAKFFARVYFRFES
jgi:hypothetical protein